MATPFAEEIFRLRKEHAVLFPSRGRIYRFVDELENLLFPHLSGEHAYFAPEEIDGALTLFARDFRKLFGPGAADMPRTLDEITEAFFAALPAIYRKIWRDAEAIHEGDPASESIDEVISAYPGFFAIYVHRVAHALYGLDVPILPRILSEYAHVRTGIDIHPGAAIGETAAIGDNVKIYQGVSLGALSVSKAMADTKRHPTVEDNVVIYSNAVILGGNTVIGHDSIVGGSVWLTRSVPPYSVVYHEAGFKLRNKQADQVAEEAIDFVI